eukprot:CAMPEP_0201281724 /NCGR_PEP_ID=MMETSP1317-20130820/3913_1 /ASSEMBLY_ACC=CAM_ASM_000770 /TAXON_ID=187299 /ORGANISM="Undescribed Undescribed, Strain Undescribed" /LENGTH=59 /DNA_ID=CAMNT_0047592447 /DNA_START=407 /DNA_END=582 /DNA_ORIENTATION=+
MTVAERIGSLIPLIRLGVKCGANYNTGYSSKTPSGTRMFSSIARIVIAAAKFPPAESPA